MQKSFIFVFLFLVSAAMPAQDIFLPEDSVGILLCRIWEPDKSRDPSYKKNPSPDSAILEMHFHENRKVVISFANQSGSPQFFDWKYETREGFISISRNREEYFRIVSLNQRKLIVVLPTSGPEPAEPRIFVFLPRV